MHPDAGHSPVGSAPPAVLDHIRALINEANPGKITAAEQLKISEYHELRRRLATIGRDRLHIRPHTAAAQTSIDRAAFQDADARLVEGETSAWRSPAQIELRKERGEVALLACEPQRAERLFETAAAYLDPYAPDAAAELRNAAASALHRHGRIYGAGAGQAAAKLFRKNLNYWRRDRRPEKWAMTQNNLGNVLHESALECEGADCVSLLREAVRSYRYALKVYDKANYASKWSAAQGNLATALGNLARHSQGAEATKLFEEAALACRNALSVHSRGAKPARWASLQAELNLALDAAARGAPKADGARLLEEAASAGEAALEIYSRDKTPAHWAVTSNNLGNTLRAQAAMGGGGASLQKAVSAYRAALSTISSEKGREDKSAAAIRTNLALALTDLCAHSDRHSAARFASEAVKEARAAVAARAPAGGMEQWFSSQCALIGALRAEAASVDNGKSAKLAAESAALCREALNASMNHSNDRQAHLYISLAQALEIEMRSGSNRKDLLQREIMSAYASAMSRIDRAMQPGLYAQAQAGRKRAANRSAA